MLATTITQRHACGHERYAADDEDLTCKRGGITRLGKRTVRGLLLGDRSLCSSLRNLRLGLRLSLGMILVVLGLSGSQGILGIAKLGKRGGIGVVGIGQPGIGIAQSSLEVSGGIDGGLIASVGSVQLDQHLVARRARGKGCLVVDSLKIGLECLVVGKLGLGLDDLEVRIDDGFVGSLELLLGIGDTGDGSVIGGLGVVDRLLGAGEALEGLVCGGKLALGGLGLLLCVGQGLRLGGNCLLGVRKSGRGVHICGLSLVNASLGSVVGLLGIVKRALLVRKVRLGGIALGGKVLDRSSGVVIRLVGLVGFCLGGIAGAASLRLVSGGLGCLFALLSASVAFALSRAAWAVAALLLAASSLVWGVLTSTPLSLASAASYAVFAAAVLDLAFSYSPLAVFTFVSAAV